jgi:hypothetical protein
MADVRAAHGHTQNHATAEAIQKAVEKKLEGGNTSRTTSGTSLPRSELWID